jgi:hypothetical protein
MMMSMNEFVEYVFSFYGAGGLYDFDASIEEIKNAIKVRLENAEMEFVADTVDRELVRDIMLENRGQ